MILNRQRRVRVPVWALKEFLAHACKALHLSPEAMTVCLVTNSEMARWNLLYRRKARPTDVLSFPAEPLAGGGDKRRSLRRKLQNRNAGNPFPVPLKNYLGDIAIAPQVARRNAKQFGRSLSNEMRILILHGILHLIGYDHETDTGQMERRERRLRRALGLG
jgi:probable rRNA maturation factor